MRARVFLLALALALAALAGCASYALRQSIRVRASDWTMYGGDAARSGVARESLALPLALRWDYDASAGFSAYSAVVADSIVIVGNLRGEVHAIRLRTGEGVGMHDFGEAVIGTPVIGKQFLYVPLSREEKSLVAYDLETGTTRWETAAGDIESAPLLLRDKIYVAALGGTVSCVDAATGAVVWSYAVPASRRSAAMRSAPASDGTLLFVGRDDGTLCALGLDDGKLRWSARAGAAIAGSPAVAAGRVIVGALDGSVYAFDAATGAVLWTRPLGSRIFASPAVDAEHVCIGTSGGVFAALRPATGEVVWQTRLNSVISAAPLISGSAVYVGCLDRTLNAFSLASGERLWRYEARGRIKSAPVIWGGYLVVLMENRTVLGFSEGGTP
jgi:outer membrane protein assembly factor BamB